MNLYDILDTTKIKIEDLINNIELYYLSYPIKKSNGKLRWLDAPQEPLKAIQKILLESLLYTMPVHECAVGFVKNKSVKDGAKKHIGSKALLCLDIKDFFSSIKTNQIYRLSLLLLGHLSDIKSDFKFDRIKDVGILANLLSYKGVLPQGAPTSPALANIFCFEMDKRLKVLAEEHKIEYSRYADDLAFSTMDSTLDMGIIGKKVDKIITEYELKLNTKKTRILRPHRRMTVTGVVVNKKINIPKVTYRNLRAELHNLNRDNTILTEKQHQKLRGQIEWINTLHKDRGEKLLHAFGKIILKKSSIIDFP